MKTKFFFRLLVCLVLGFCSCNKDDNPERYSGSKITVEVLGVTSNKAFVGLEAKDVKELGKFTVGFCYSTNAGPTVSDEHYELTVETDTITDPDLYMFYLIEDLTKSTDYNIKGYLKLDGDVFYSANKSFKTEASTLYVEVSYNYIPAGREYWIVLSDNSTPLVTQKLENGQDYVFSTNIPDVADFHIFKWDPSNNRLYVESYTDIVPDEFYLEYPYYNFQSGVVSVSVSGLGNYLSWGIASSWWWNTTTLSTTSTLSTALTRNPDDLFIHYLPSDGSAPRYKVVNNVTPGSNYSYTNADFTEMTDFTNIELPANVFFNYTLAGFNTDYYTEFKKFHGYSYASGYPGTFKLYYPAGINTNYYLYTLYNTSNTQSFYNKIGPMPTTFFTTFPTITINNSSQFKTTTSAIDNYSTYEVMDFCGIYSNSGLYVQWDYYKQPQASNSIQIPEFPAELKSLINNISTSDLSFSDVGYFDIINSPVNSYESYVDLLIKESERLYDVIKERRYYFQWENKKAFDSKTGVDEGRR